MASFLSLNKSLELDKICRVCLIEKKDMKHLFEDKLLVADMLMEVAHVEIENTDGWPDKICIQCVHQVSRCHAFKNRVERSDQELRNYIKSLTVVIEEPTPVVEVTPPPPQIQKITRPQAQQILNTSNVSTIQADQRQHQQPQSQSQQIQTIQPQVVLSNGQLHNSQILNAQLINSPQLTQIVNASQLGQLIQGNTVQVVNGQPVVFQRTSSGEERCEIIMHPDLDEAEYFEDVIENTEDVIDLDHNIIEEEHDDEMEDDIDDEELQFVEELEEMEQEEEHIHEHELEQEYENEHEQEHEHEIEHEHEHEHVHEHEHGHEHHSERDQEEEEHEHEHEHEHQNEEDIENEEIYHEHEERIDDSLETDNEPDKEFVAEFISSQTTCLGPGRFVCNLCRKEFKQSKWLQTHMKSHSNWIKANCKKQPQCNICHRSFKGPGMLKMHMKTHEQKPYQCGNCSKLFSSPYTLNSHMTNKHANERCKFKCSQCEDVLYNLDLLKAHIDSNCNNKHLSEDSL